MFHSTLEEWLVIFSLFLDLICYLAYCSLTDPCINTTFMIFYTVKMLYALDENVSIVLLLSAIF